MNPCRFSSSKSSNIICDVPESSYLWIYLRIFISARPIAFAAMWLDHLIKRKILNCLDINHLWLTALEVDIVLIAIA
jgi:hypothetical protein